MRERTRARWDSGHKGGSLLFKNKDGYSPYSPTAPTEEETEETEETEDGGTHTPTAPAEYLHEYKEQENEGTSNANVTGMDEVDLMGMGEEEEEDFPPNTIA